MAQNEKNDELEATDESLKDVKERVEQIQRQHRGKIRWRITKHTAEIAIRAIESADGQAVSAPRSGKSRRRKRHKRLL
jgi:hypothetical protein